jgi:hypothetical protein
MTARRRPPAQAQSRSLHRGSALYRAATSPVARAAYVGVAAVGLTALVIAIFGPKRFQQVVVQPVRSAVADQTERLWAEARPLRSQLSHLMARATTESGRQKLVQSFQSWIGHFRAS